MAHDMVRLAGIGHFGGDEVLKAAGDFVGHAVKQIDALVGRQPAPHAVAGSMGGAHGGVDVGLAGFGNVGDDFVVERRTLLESLAFASLDKLTVDEILDQLHGISLLGCTPSRRAGILFGHRAWPNGNESRGEVPIPSNTLFLVN